VKNSQLEIGVPALGCLEREDTWFDIMQYVVPA